MRQVIWKGWLVAVLLGALLLPGRRVAGQSPRPEGPAASEPTVRLTLADCLQLAYRQRPKLRAAQAILSQRQVQHAEVERMARTLSLLRPDLKIRRHQAALGVEIAEVAVASQEADVRYSVARTYLSVLYARSAHQIGQQALDRVQVVRVILEKLRMLKKIPVLTTPLDLLSAQILQVESQLAEAERGEKVALAALKQAIGFDPAHPLTIVEAPLPALNVAIPGEVDLLRLVQERNPDLRRVSLAEQVFHLEVEAQKKSNPLVRTADTFAAAGDIHAAPTPAEATEEVYRPAPMAPEMPAQLVGTRAGRIASAERFAAKAAEATRGVGNLVNLHAIDTREAFLEKRRKIVLTEKWLRDRAGELRWLLGVAPTERPDDVSLQGGIQAIGVLANLEKLRFEALIELLELERITLGGFQAGVSEAIRPARSAR